MPWKFILINERKIRFLVAGAINTIFGYATGVALYKLLVPPVNLIFVIIAANVLSITFSFLTYKIFVFRTSGRWLVEYCRAYLVYGGIALLGILLTLFFLQILGLSIWLTQALVSIVAIVVSYISHKRFTFRMKE